MRSLVIIGLLPLLAGCQASGPWYVDSRFTAAEQAEIQQAANMWEGVGQEVNLVFGVYVNGQEDHGRHIVRENTRGGQMLFRDLTDTESGHYSHPNMWTQRIIIVPQQINQSTAPMYMVLAHELGHSLGLEHLSDTTALMYRTSSPDAKWCITKADVAEMCRTVGCPGTVPKGCDE